MHNISVVQVSAQELKVSWGIQIWYTLY